jgi:Beta-galactosidase/beta-glucuronidase
LFDASNKPVVSQKYDSLSLEGNQESTLYHKLKVENPKLWSIETPYLYHLETLVKVDGKNVDSYNTNVEFVLYVLIRT